MRTLIDNLPDRIYAKDRDSRFLINNRAHLHVLGADAGQTSSRQTRRRLLVAGRRAGASTTKNGGSSTTGEPIIDQEQTRTSRDRRASAGSR